MKKELKKQPATDNSDTGFAAESKQLKSTFPPPMQLMAGPSSSDKDAPLQRMMGDGPAEADLQVSNQQKLDHYLGAWHGGLQNEGKKTTLASLKALKQEGAIRGQSLLYLGGDADIEHPLMATPATHLTFVGMSPDVIAGKAPAEANAARAEDHTRHLNDIKRKLGEIGLPFEETHIQAGAVSQLTVRDETGDVLVSIEYHTKTYNEYVAALGGRQFDIVMDKDSWLKGWQDFEDERVPAAIAPMVREGGLWMGGFESDSGKANVTTDALFNDVTAGTVGENQKWSGYEDMKVRTRTATTVGEAQEIANASQADLDPVWTAIATQILPTLEEHLNRPDGNLDHGAYTGLLDALEYTFPYIEGVDADYCEKMATYLHGKIDQFNLIGADTDQITHANTVTKLREFLA